MIATGRGVYWIALAAGAAYAVWLLSWQAILPADPLHAAFLGDEAVSVIGQRYLLGGPWHWPPLLAPGLAGGTNVALTDSIPLAMLALKPVRALLMPGATTTASWVALMLALQPVSAVFALRTWGERRAAPAVAVAVLAAVMPTLLNRYGHQALCSHAAILLALGLYARLASGRGGLLAAAALMPCSLLIHPYIFATVAPVLAAAPLTRLLRREPGWYQCAAGLAGALVLCGGLAWTFGYGGSRPASGFGVYSMNLLAPALPDQSALFPALAVDATGGQASEGYQYLGAGLLLLMAVAAVPVLRGRVALRRHGGLLLVLAALAVFALSDRAYAGSVLLYRWGPVPPWLEQFRATSRFFWPVAYAGLLGGVAIVARALPPRPALAVLAAAVVLQVADTGPLRAAVRASAAASRWTLDVDRLRPVFGGHDALTLWPSFGCGAAADQPTDMQIMLLGSETLMSTNTMATARDRSAADCSPAGTIGSPVRPGELRVLTRPGDAWWVSDAAAVCHVAGPLVLCSQDGASLAGLPPLAVPPLPPGQRIGPRDALFGQVTGPGWSVREAGGVWSDGPTAILLLQRPSMPVAVQLGLTALAPEPGAAQPLSITVDGAPCGSWQMPDLLPRTVTCTLPASGSPVARVALRVAQPVRPVDRGMPGDTRQLGVLLRSVQVGGVSDGR